jgi:hypothetical protein
LASRWLADFKNIMETAHVLQIRPRESGPILTNEPFDQRHHRGVGLDDLFDIVFIAFHLSGD